MKQDWDKKPESVKRTRFAHAAMPLAAVMLVTGCSWVPDWADPTEWFGSGSELKTSESAEAFSVKTPGKDKGFPNLASVPERPRAPSQEDQRRLADSLEADRGNAEYSKEIIRRQSASKVAPPPSAASLRARAAAAAKGRTNVAAPAASDAGQKTIKQLPLSSPPMPQEASASVAPVLGSTLSQAPVSRPPRFAPRPPAPAVPGVDPNTIPPLAVQPNPNVRSVARIGNPIFAAPPADITAAQVVGQPRQTRSRYAPLTPHVPGTFSNGNAHRGADPLATVGFRAGSAALSQSARRQLRRIAAMYKKRGRAIRVEGHASSRTRNMDSVQHHLVNLNVSLDRANAVARELVRRGVPPEALFVAAMSDSQPLYYEVMPAGDAGNQRVEIHFVN